MTRVSAEHDMSLYIDELWVIGSLGLSQALGWVSFQIKVGRGGLFGPRPN
jgi:hypothetical protein